MVVGDIACQYEKAYKMMQLEQTKQITLLRYRKTKLCRQNNFKPIFQNVTECSLITSHCQ
jgi:hypothetical protein